MSAEKQKVSQVINMSDYYVLSVEDEGVIRVFVGATKQEAVDRITEWEKINRIK